MTTSTHVPTVAPAPLVATLPPEAYPDDAASAFDDFAAGSWADFLAARALYLRRRAEAAGRPPEGKTT